MIERLFKNWITTIISLVILITLITMVCLGVATLKEVGIFITGAFALLFLKDDVLSRIVKDKCTSITGVIVMIVCFGLVFMKYASLSEVNYFITGAGVLLLVPDTKKNE